VIWAMCLMLGELAGLSMLRIYLREIPKIEFPDPYWHKSISVSRNLYQR